MVKLVHAADLHVDSPLRGLDRYEGAPVEAFRLATRRAFANLIRFTIEERADLLLLAGDLFDGSWRDFGTGLFFAAELAKLREVGTRVVLVRGNHDAASVVTAHLRLAEHVTELSTTAPDTRVFEDLGIAVHGQGYRTRAVREDLAALCPPPLAGLLNVGLLHTSLDGRPGHEVYAPTRKETLAAKGYGYWALGHVHAREVVSTDPWVVFAGNLQGRHARELGAKGATLVTVEDTRVVSVEARDLDVVRWAHVSVSATDARVVDEVIERADLAVASAAALASPRPLAVRVTVSGAPGVGSALCAEVAKLEATLRLALVARHGEALFVEKVRARLVASETPLALAALAPSLADEALERAELERDLLELERRLPAELRADGEADPGPWLDEVLGRARASVLEALVGSPEGSDA